MKKRALGDVLAGQRDPLGPFLSEPAGTEQHHLAPDVRRIVFDLEIAFRADSSANWSDPQLFP